MSEFFELAGAIRRLSIFAIPLFFGITCHEVGHGLAAWRLGDLTAKHAGRLTINPLKHFDLLGAITFVLTLFLNGFVIGWAKPVPVMSIYFRDPRRGMILVSLAGPTANIFLALVFGLVFKLLLLGFEGNITFLAERVLLPLIFICGAGIQVNIVLALFNLIPIPPLDGGQILSGLLPSSIAIRFQSLERYGFLIVLLLLASGLSGIIFLPIFQIFLAAIVGLYDLPRFFFDLAR
ncbi:Peptidase, M50 family [Desulfovibrionales bacterium]